MTRLTHVALWLLMVVAPVAGYLLTDLSSVFAVYSFLVAGVLLLVGLDIRRETREIEASTERIRRETEMARARMEAIRANAWNPNRN